jgi:hypothetical protein
LISKENSKELGVRDASKETGLLFNTNTEDITVSRVSVSPMNADYEGEDRLGRPKPSVKTALGIKYPGDEVMIQEPRLVSYGAGGAQTTIVVENEGIK